MRKILFVIAIGFIAYGYYQIRKDEPNKKVIRITQVDTIEVFENNFDSIWEVYGCRYYGYKQQEK
jgi:hypothetical protein